MLGADIYSLNSGRRRSNSPKFASMRMSVAAAATLAQRIVSG
jgi:hypothetical protein